MAFDLDRATSFFLLYYYILRQRDLQAHQPAHKSGCKCRKSMCLKKYCECFEASLPCSSTCICADCHNTPSDITLFANHQIGIKECAGISSIAPKTNRYHVPVSTVVLILEDIDVLMTTKRREYHKVIIHINFKTQIEPDCSEAERWKQLSSGCQQEKCFTRRGR